MIEITPYYLILFFRTIINIVIIASSLYISIRANNLYSLSSYKGFKIFRNTFLFYTLAFILDYILFLINSSYISSPSTLIFGFMLFLFYFCLTAAGFYLVYSLVWKEFEKHIKFLKKDIFSNKDLLLIIDALAVSILTFFWNENILFIVIIAMLAYASMLSYQNYKKSRKTNKRNNYPQLYFISIILAFMGYSLNYLVWFFPIIKIYVLLLTSSIFVIFLYGVIHASKKIE